MSDIALKTEHLVEVGHRVKILFQEMHKIIIGQDEVIEQMLVAMLCRAHCVVVGAPGLAKTLMVRTLADICAMQFKRVQFTPDLMPSDIIGADILEEDAASRRRSFVFNKGPIFTNLLLADEINRTPPKTQAALLEAMQEYAVTTGGTRYELPLPFFVLATQNPIEQEGTYPLPEAQLDRFMFEVWIDYPGEKDEEEIVRQTTKESVAQLRHVITGKDILRLQQIVRQTPVSDHVIKYATRLVRATRPRGDKAPDFIKQYVTWGCGPRAAQFLILGAKAQAILQGRPNVSCVDVRALVPPIFRHRMFTNFAADAEGITPMDLIQRLMETIKEPGQKDYQ
ncbi:MAG: MoxR family ATPase [Candidatus Sumerlaeota bacterium]|nr:MoxR family ATPase [Candidatus Sumerlaeota bacterium]